MSRVVIKQNRCLTPLHVSSMLGLLGVSLLLNLSPVSSRAAILAYEGFDYPSGTSLTNQVGGSGWSGGWVANGSVGAGATNVGTSLGYTDGFGNSLQTTGGSAFLSGNSTANTSATPYRDIPATRGTNDGTTTWISFIGQRTGPVTNTVAPYFQRVASVQLREGGTERVAFGRATSSSDTAVPKDTWAMYFGGSALNTLPSAISLSNAPATLVVMRVDHLAGNDNLYMFLNPPLNVEPATNTANLITNGNPTFSRIQLFAGNTTAAGLFAQLRLDEIRIGDTFADVTPYTPASGSPPVITVNLTNQLRQLCSSASFFINATSTTPLGYQWYLNNAPVGGNSNSLVLNALTTADAGNYFVIVTNASGAVTSAVVALTLQDTTLPNITQCATNQTLLSDGSCQAIVPDLTGQIVATDCTGIASVTQSPIAGSTIGTGNTIVTLTVTDGSNNVATCQATLNVLGSGAPTILSCAPNQFLNADLNQQANIPDLASLVVATNPCGSVTVTQSPLAGTIVSPGVHVVTLTAVTGSGTTNCSANVNVNARPVATGKSVSIAQNTATNIALLGSDADGSSLTFLIVSNPTNGALGALSSNLVTYTPNTNYVGVDAFTFVLHDGSATSAVATVSIAISGGAIVYPTTFVVKKGGAAVLIEDYATVPLSARGGSLASPTASPNMADLLARVTFMKSEPTNAPQSVGRFFVVDMNRQLYVLNKTNKAFTPYINFQAIFPRFYNAGGFAGGLNPVEFDPEYAANGLFYTSHLETNSTASAMPVNTALPALNLTGYTTTTRVNPPTGTVTYESVLVEWRDTNINNATFEGTAREILRVGLNNRIHPMGDLLFNPLATPGHPDYRNLYIAQGDGAAGEGTATRTTPQRLDALQGKILRITPDINLRPSDELSANGRYRIPTTGSDTNPFVAVSLPGLRKEIFAYGFRNCHRISWDKISNKLIEDDIGLNSWEEVNIVRKGGNYGYSEREGPEQLFVGSGNLTGSQQVPAIAFPTNDSLIVTGLVSAVTPIYPVAQYSHWDGDGIASGFVYRGSLMPALYGKYIFGDIPNGRLFYADYDEMLAADDGNRNTVATTHELQIVYNHPNDNPDAGLTRWRMFDICAVTYTNRGGNIASQRLPGTAESTGPGKLDIDGVAYGRGRADIRLAQDNDGEIYITSKSDGMIRKLVAALSPPMITSITNNGSNVTMTWQSVPGWNYRVQYKDDLSDALWTDLSGDVNATGITASKTAALTGDKRFFRVRWLP